MKLIAGLDIQNNKCVHLTQGNLDSSRIFSEKPIEFCKVLEEKAVSKLHIVDIDGVFSGQTQMFDLLAEIRAHTKLPIQFGGGIRNFETAKRILDIGIENIVLGTSAMHDQDLLVELLECYGDRIIVAADVYKGYVYIEGWEENSSTTLVEFLKTLSLLHVQTVMITDITKDGTLSGPDKMLLDEILNKTNLKIILSGGVSSDKDIAYLKTKEIEGIVVSTAIYEGLITI